MMTRTAIIFAATVMIVPIRLASALEKTCDHVDIKGTWEYVSAIFKGKVSKSPKGIWAVSNTHVKYSFDAKDEYTLFPEKNPKWIDVVSIREGEEPKRLYGIYSLNGDTLTVCVGFSKENRPAKFESAEGSEQNLLGCDRHSQPDIV